MWAKKVFLSVWFRGIVASFTPFLGLIGLVFLSINGQIATNNEIIFLALSLPILHFLINLALPFAVNWIKAILAVIPTSSLVLFFGFVSLMASAMYGSSVMARTFSDSLLLLLAAAASIIFAWLGARMGILLEKIPNTKFNPPLSGRVLKNGLLILSSIFSLVLVGIFLVTLLSTWQTTQNRAKRMDTSGWSITRTPETSTIYAIRKDKQGSLWIGGENNGLQRFDGKTWQGYFENQTIHTIEFDRKGRLWASGDSNIILVDENGPQETTTAGRVVETVDREGRVWYNVNDDDYLPLGEENPGQAVNLPGIWWLGFGPDGKLWAWCSYNENGFRIASKSENEAWNFQNFSSTLSSSTDADAIAFDKQGFPWIAVYEVGGQGQQFIHYNGKSWENEKVPLSSIKALLFDQQGRLWVAFSDTKTGLAVSENGNWTFFSTDQITEGGTDGVHALYLDDAGLLWFGTGGSLVSFNTLGPLPAAKPLPDNLANTRPGIPLAALASGIAALIMVVLTLKVLLSR